MEGYLQFLLQPKPFFIYYLFIVNMIFNLIKILIFYFLSFNSSQFLTISGDNTYGVFGVNPPNNNILQKTFFTTQQEKIVDISINYYHTLLIKKDIYGQNKLYSTGRNIYGQLGLGHTISQTLFQEVSGVTPKKVSVGNDHSMVLSNDSFVYVFGDNYVFF